MHTLHFVFDLKYYDRSNWCNEIPIMTKKQQRNFRKKTVKYRFLEKSLIFLVVIGFEWNFQETVIALVEIGFI